METYVRRRTGGDGEPTLLLLHGMGATGDVWAGCESVLAREWRGRWVAPDLPGHGGSSPLSEYTFQGLAVGLAQGLRQALDGCRDVVVLGHSLGGVLGLALAGGAAGFSVRLVVGLGIKTTWTDADLARSMESARRPVAWFASRDEAAARYLRVCGLAGLVPLEDAAVDAGLRCRVLATTPTWRARSRWCG